MRKRICAGLLTVLLLWGTAMSGAAAQAPGTAGEEGKKLIALTFDDGPTLYTEQLLDGLKERQIYATFFMVGKNIAKYPETAKRVWLEGHQLASHTYTHPRLKTLPIDEVMEELQKTEAALEELCGEAGPYLVRPPYGSTSEQVEAVSGAPMVHWDVDSLDWESRDAEAVCSTILREVKDGSIILVHDSTAPSVEGALTAVDRLQALGYEFVTVNELFRRRGEALVNGKRYYSGPGGGTDLGEIKAPVIRAVPEGNKFRVTITAQPGLDIRYTVDRDAGFDRDSPVYTGPFLISAPSEVRAVAVRDWNGGRSRVAEAYATEQGKFYRDVPKNAWYYEDVNWAVTKGYLLGSGDGGYQPVSGVTRGQFITLLYRYAGEKADGEDLAACKFSDVGKDDYYREAVAWAAARKLVSGYGDGTFRPERRINRQEMCQLFYNFLLYRGIPLQDGKGSAARYQDGRWISHWALEAVEAMTACGLVRGDETGDFVPYGKSTRAQAVTMIRRLENFV